MHVCAHVCACACVCMYLPGQRTKDKGQRRASDIFHLIPLRQGLSLDLKLAVFWGSVSIQDPGRHLTSTSDMDTFGHSQLFYTLAGDENLGLHSCAASALTH